jgi:hypothetical protein
MGSIFLARARTEITMLVTGAATPHSQANAALKSFPGVSIIDDRVNNRYVEQKVLV